MDLITLAMAKAYTNSQRLGWTETSKIVIVPESDLVAEGIYVTDTDGVYGGFFALMPEVAPADKIVICIDGVEYEREILPVTDDFGAACYGNPSVNNEEYEDNGDFFALNLYFEQGVFLLLIHDPDTGVQDKVGTTRTIGIHAIGETVHKIDPKYLTQTALPIQNASVGQIVAVKDVDENGVPTEFEAIDNVSGALTNDQLNELTTLLEVM